MQFKWHPKFEGEDGPIISQLGIYTHVLYKTYVGPCDI